MKGFCIIFFMFTFLGLYWDHLTLAYEQNILVLGGSGFIGASVVVKLVEKGHTVTMVSRGNWYWDSKERAKEKADRFIKCDRDDDLEKCAEFKDFIDNIEHVDAVYDFSTRTGEHMKDIVQHLAGKVGIYIFISTASIYDVCEKKHDDVTKETDATRPESQEEQMLLKSHHKVGHDKFEAEEKLMAQRLNDGGFPFVILRLPDVFGPRDTTYRFAIYHLWAKLSTEIKDHPVSIPEFLGEHKISFVYSEDVANMATELLSMGPQIRDQAVNLAYPQGFTMVEFIKQIQTALGHSPGENFDFWPKDYDRNFYLYPTVSKGPMDVTKAQSLLEWAPTPFSEAVKATVDFFEEAMSSEKFVTQRNEIIQIVGHQVYPDDTKVLYETLENLYKIDLKHFLPKDEL